MTRHLYEPGQQGQEDPALPAANQGEDGALSPHLADGRAFSRHYLSESACRAAPCPKVLESSVISSETRLVAQSSLDAF